MRKNTKEKLYDLAQIIAETHCVKEIVGSNDFINIAIHENDENDIELSLDLLNKYESELKRITLRIENDMIEEQESIDIKNIRESLNARAFGEKRLVATIEFYADGTFVKTTHEKEKPGQKIPNYTMFAESEDGHLILKGKYKGKYVFEINMACGFDTAAAGWAIWLLKADKNLTDDDREVLNLIATNKYDTTSL